MAKHSMYDETPSITHDEEGHTKIEKPKKKESAEHSEGKGKKETKADDLDVHERHSHERLSMHHEHMHEHMKLHHKHTGEHGHHDGHKEPLHTRHEGEMKDMHKKHHSEMEAMHTKHEKEAGATGGSTVGEPIEKIEKGAKE